MYVNKKVQLRRSKRLLINNAIRQTYLENLVLIKYNGRYEALYFPIAKYHHTRKHEIPRQRFERETSTHLFVYDSVFVDLTSYPQFIVTVQESKMSSQFPIFWGNAYIKIHPNTEVYFTPSLYEKLKTKMAFGSLITLTDLESFNLRSKYSFVGLNKNFYTFVNKDPNKTWTLSAQDFVLINDNIEITTPKQTVLNFNKFVENDGTSFVKVKPPEKLIEKLQSDELNFLQANKINIRSLTYAHENFFLYDLENMIKPTFTTELQQEFNIYGLIYFSGDQNNKLHLIRPKSRLKFQFDKDIYKKQIKIELGKVH